jgi:hypothetical protein
MDLDREIESWYKQFNSLINDLKNIPDGIALNEWEKQLLIWSLGNPTLEMQEKNKAIQLVYQTKKQEIMVKNIFNQFNILSRNIWSSANAIIKSNEELAKSNEENQENMNNLTKRIMGATIVQALAAAAWLIINFCK